MCSEAQAGKAEPFPVPLINHHSTNEIKFLLRGFPGCGSLLLVAASLKLKLLSSLASGELQPGLVNATARTGLAVPRVIPPARADRQAVDGECGFPAHSPLLFQTQETSLWREKLLILCFPLGAPLFPLWMHRALKKFFLEPWMIP